MDIFFQLLSLLCIFVDHVSFNYSKSCNHLSCIMCLVDFARIQLFPLVFLAISDSSLYGAIVNRDCHFTIQNGALTSFHLKIGIVNFDDEEDVKI